MNWLDDYKHRFFLIAVLLGIYVAAIFWQSIKTVIIDGDHYRARVEKLRVDSVPIAPLRGFIYAEGGEMMAGSLPRYDVYMDFRSTTRIDENGRMNIPDSVITRYFGARGEGSQVLARLDSSRSAAEHGRRVLAAYDKRNPHFKVLSKISYMDYHHNLRLKGTPYFGWNRYRNGLKAESLAYRYRPYGSNRMAASVIGSVYAKTQEKGQESITRGSGGLEQALDSLLRGKPGMAMTQVIRNHSTDIELEKPINGLNIHTTIDIEMQQILDHALAKRIGELAAHGGWAAIMEVETGKIKAISNLVREAGGRIVEDHNHLFEDLVDPGSTFKTVSYMVMLDDGKITPETIIDTGNTDERRGEFVYYGQRIRDDHPVGVVTADEAMVQSSNIALAKLTTQAYAQNPQRYLDGIERIGFLNDRKLSDEDSATIRRLGYITDLDFRREFPKAQAARHRQISGRSWSRVSLAQISYGYETQIPGIYMLQFYNAIANDGCLVRPYIVDYIDDEEGRVQWKQETTVINKRICKPATLKAVRRALEGVTERGTASGKWIGNREILPGAKSKKVAIAGKTGTAQRINTATGTYSGAGHNVSFVGYFPADNPKYSGIVVIDARPGGNFGRPGGGYMAGPVFRDFAEQIYALRGRRSLKQLDPDTLHQREPFVKKGDPAMTSYVLGKLGLSHAHFESVSLSRTDHTKIPNLVGMGASDALFLLESLGLRVNMVGFGTVVSQSIPPGSAFQRGQTIGLSLK